ncbi:MAG: phosphoribosylamine--glycine ligase [Bacteroidota bacterium]
MRLLVVGSGGREHALCYALAQSRHAPHLLCAPGNAGTASLAENVPVAADDVQGLVALAEERSVDLVVVGPEVPLVLGLTDALKKEDIQVVGPSAAAAQLEGSKAFAKAFMDRHAIPTARSRTFTSDAYAQARMYVEAHALPLVLKADGLAAGKGVLIPTTRADALEGLDQILRAHAFGKAGAKVVVEDFMDGEEASVFVLTDGMEYVLFAAAQDHKRIGEGDTGPNTGGMGAYAPAPIVTAEVLAQVEARIVQPTLRGMAQEGMPYRGFLYVGLMITQEGPKVVEYNCRLGDPETQVVLPLLKTDFLDLLRAQQDHLLSEIQVQMHDGAAACVVVASEGYPGPYEKGQPISGLGQTHGNSAADGLATSGGSADTMVYHAGTQRDEAGTLVTSGGRVLGVTARGASLQAALDAAYARVDTVCFDGMQFRRDIGQKGLSHLAG